MRRIVAATSRAPGRVTLVGEHTDYNEGRSLGVATTQATIAVATRGTPGALEVASAALGTARCALARPEGPAFLVLAASLAAAAGVDGARLAIDGDLPIGAGLSSSAAYAVAVALALGLTGDPLALADACRDAEHAAGSVVGLLDPLVVLAAEEGRVVELDFARRRVATFALHPAIGLTVVDSGERRAVGETAYAQRRAQCEAAAARIGPLGLARPDDLAELADPVLRRRARHVVTECARVDEGRAALVAGDLAGFGRLLDASHASLRDDFEVSTARVDETRAALLALRGVAGARLVGAGFGGCLLVAHEPGAGVALEGRWSSRVRPGAGASVSPTR